MKGANMKILKEIKEYATDKKLIYMLIWMA